MLDRDEGQIAVPFRLYRKVDWAGLWTGHLSTNCRCGQLGVRGAHALAMVVCCYCACLWQQREATAVRCVHCG